MMMNVIIVLTTITHNVYR